MSSQRSGPQFLNAGAGFRGAVFPNNVSLLLVSDDRVCVDPNWLPDYDGSGAYSAPDKNSDLVMPDGYLLPGNGAGLWAIMAMVGMIVLATG
jgi:hypothetical protein